MSRQQPPDRDNALIWYERAARQGYAGALQMLTSMKMSSEANANELQEVFQMWLKAAQEGESGAQRMVGDFYLRGVGTVRSASEARRWRSSW